MNDIHSVENYINGIPKFSAKTTHENLRAVLELLGNPDKAYKAVHIAGTNGKGSVSLMTSLMLEKSGYRTGLFVSPHLIRINERITINGEMISDTDFVDTFHAVMEAVHRNEERGGVHPSYFEMLFIMAAYYFAKMKCDYVVFETGLGGRLDATNVVTPVVTAITSIGMDHMQYLGDTIEAIAYEKAGIIKPGIPVISHVTGPAAEVIRSTAAERGAEYIDVSSDTVILGEVIQDEGAGGGVTFDLKTPVNTYQGLNVNTYADYQVENASTAVRIYETMQLENAHSEGVVREALGDFTVAGRFEFLTDNVILDGAHNEAAVAKLCESVDRYKSVIGTVENVALLFAVSEDKDYDSVIREFVHGLRPSRIYISGLSTSRRLSPETARAVFEKYTSADTAIKCYDNILGAYRNALDELGSDELLICAGSLYLSEELKAE